MDLTEKILAKISGRMIPLEERLEVLLQLVPLNYTPEEIALGPRTKDLREVRLELSFLTALHRQVEKHVKEYGPVSDSVYGNNAMCSCGHPTYPCSFINEVAKDLEIEIFSGTQIGSNGGGNEGFAGEGNEGAAESVLQSVGGMQISATESEMQL